MTALKFINPTHHKSTEAKAGLPGGKMLITTLQDVWRMALQAQDNSGISGTGGQAYLLQIIYCSQNTQKKFGYPTGLLFSLSYLAFPPQFFFLFLGDLAPVTRSPHYDSEL